ncbi:hypothetical protein P0E61_13790 [Enterococcus faecalis]|nr:hypothetical protein [Enterococcus faecalis]
MGTFVVPSTNSDTAYVFIGACSGTPDDGHAVVLGPHSTEVSVCK